MWVVPLVVVALARRGLAVVLVVLRPLGQVALVWQMVTVALAGEPLVPTRFMRMGCWVIMPNPFCRDLHIGTLDWHSQFTFASGACGQPFGAGCW